MKNENPEKSLWRSEANAKAFHSKRPCVCRQTLRSFRTNALVSFLQALKWRFLRTLFSISSVNLEFPGVTEWKFISLHGVLFVAETAFLFSLSSILGSFLFLLEFAELLFLHSLCMRIDLRAEFPFLKKKKWAKWQFPHKNKEVKRSFLTIVASNYFSNGNT